MQFFEEVEDDAQLYSMETPSTFLLTDDDLSNGLLERVSSFCDPIDLIRLAKTSKNLLSRVRTATSTECPRLPRQTVSAQSPRAMEMHTVLHFPMWRVHRRRQVHHLQRGLNVAVFTRAIPAGLHLCSTCGTFDEKLL